MAKLSKSALIIKLYMEDKEYQAIMDVVGVTHGRVSSTLNRARLSGRIPANYRKRPGPNNPVRKVQPRVRFRKRTPEAMKLALLGKRKCSKCKKAKRVGSRSWDKDSSRGDGWYPVCKACVKHKNKKSYREAKRKVIRGAK